MIKIWKFDGADESSVSTNDELRMAQRTFCIQSLCASKQTHRIAVALESVLHDHSESIYSLAWHPDRLELLSSGSNQSVVRWAYSLSDSIWLPISRFGEIVGEETNCYDVTYSPCGKFVLCHSLLGGFYFWEIGQKGVFPRCFPIGGHFAEVTDLCWDRSGTILLTCGSDMTTRVFARNKNLNVFFELARPQTHGHPMNCLTSVQSDLFVSGGEEKIFRVFQATSSFAQNLDALSDNYTNSKCFSSLPITAFQTELTLTNKAVTDLNGDESDVCPRDCFLFAEPPREEQLNRFTLFPEVHKLYGHGFEVFSCASSRDGRVLATCCKASHFEHANILLWDTSNWKLMKSLKAHQLTVTRLSFSYACQGTGQKASAGHNRIIWDCSWSPDSHLFATVSRDKTLKLWDFVTEGKGVTERAEVANTATFVSTESQTAVDFAPKKSRENSYLIAVGFEDGAISLFDYNTISRALQPIVEFSRNFAHSGRINRLRFQPVIDGSHKQKSDDSSRIGARTGSAASSASAGALSEEQFRSAFEAVPNVRVDSLRDLVAEAQKQAAILENLNNDWTKRIKALQSLRALIVCDIDCYGAFVEQSLALLGTALQLSVKDLRSQVCREACITIAYYCEKFGTGFWRVAETVLPTTLNLTQNSAKVMSTSGQICNFYIIKHIQHPKVLAIIVQHVNSKAKEIRKMIITLVQLIITVWDVTILEKHFPELLHCIKLVLSDADPEARALARQTFESLQSLYPTKADALFHELEPSKQRILVGSSTASSTHSINSERDNLPNPNRGLYNTQNAFLNKRSASDLNHSVRRLNLVASKVVHRPNVVRTGKPPQASPAAFKPHHSAAPTPVARKVAPAMSNKLQKSISTTDSKSASQPGSRSSSPNRVRRTPPPPPPRPQAVHAQSAVAVRKLHNGRDHHHHEIANTPVKHPAHGQPIHKEFLRALKNVDTQTRSIRPNVIRSDDLLANARSPPTVQPHFAPRPSASPSNDFYGLSQKQEAVLQRISSEEHNTSGGFRQKSSANNSADKHNLSVADGIENGQHKWSCLSSEQLANDIEQQNVFIQEICDTIGTNAAINDKEIEDALHVLSRMIREGGITLWNEYFNTIFFAIQQIISRDLTRHYYAIRISALKTLKELCSVQPKRLVSRTEMLVMNILNAHECEDATVVRAAEDCGAAVANHLPTNTCMNLLLTVIDDKNSKYHQLSGAIKMLSSVLSKLPPEEVEKLLSTIVPRMTQCYENAQSMVRRAAIICLVSISQSIGLDVLKPHLNAATLKLVEVYRERMLKRSDGGCS
uniref:Elongator complex protein 2 n=1 Tax=Globodera rostochiensis TaxID=31243 RepID=A0A914H0L9_GLORO